jgi:hypothetical protein
MYENACDKFEYLDIWMFGYLAEVGVETKF